MRRAVSFISNYFIFSCASAKALCISSFWLSKYVFSTYGILLLDLLNTYLMSGAVVWVIMLRFAISGLGDLTGSRLTLRFALALIWLRIKFIFLKLKSLASLTVYFRSETKVKACFCFD